MNIALLLQMAADAGPDRIGLVCNGKSWTYAELLSAANGAADIFEHTKCDYVALLDESSEAAFIALFGAAIAGKTYVPLNYRLADTDLAALIARIVPAYIIGDSSRCERLTTTASHTLVSRDEFVRHAVTEGASATGIERDNDGIAAQIFTSGTTAAPKAALLKHSNLLGYILGSVEFMSADEDEAALVSVPPYHIAGISALMSSCYAMRKIALLPSFSPEAWLDLASHEHVTNSFLVPTMLSRIVQCISEGYPCDINHLRAVAYGGGRMPLELIDKALDLFPSVNFTNAYGLTETSSTIALLGPDEHRQAKSSDDPAVKLRLSSVGKPLPTVEIEIRDELGNVLGANERGEIYVRGEQVSGEYREKSALTENGWFPTRDAGFIDSEGYLFLAGRADDVIVRGGENISPGEIEDVLEALPEVAEVAAVGIPSIEWGEAVGIAIVFKEGKSLSEQAICDIIRQRLRSSRVPEKILVMKELPFNEMGKLLRRKIKELF